MDAEMLDPHTIGQPGLTDRTLGLGHHRRRPVDRRDAVPARREPGFVGAGSAAQVEDVSARRDEPLERRPRPATHGRQDRIRSVRPIVRRGHTVECPLRVGERALHPYCHGACLHPVRSAQTHRRHTGLPDTSSAWRNARRLAATIDGSGSFLRLPTG